MANVFVLGPSHWATHRTGQKPISVRRQIVDTFRANGHDAFIMEDHETHPGESLTAKFLRLLEKATHVVLYWPAGAVMETSHAELVALRFELEKGKSIPDVIVPHHENVAEIRNGEFLSIEESGQIAYLMDLARYGVTILSWSRGSELREMVNVLAEGELASDT